LRLYLDSSALVKRYVDEVGSELVVEAMDGADAHSICRIGFVETVRAVARGGAPEDLARMERDWAGIDVIEVDRDLVERAARLAVEQRLRSLDALHLAAALSQTPERAPTFATWDVRLHRAAREHGLRVLPAVFG
jgi:predicted nucleic acid-binding protein